MRIETHCHSHHSFDCNTSIENIVEACNQRGINGIVICDHDVCGITPQEEELFAENGIKLFKAIEFTTQTDAHIIGVSPRIKELQRERFHYSVGELISALSTIGATIIIPHPNHGTGIVGNGKISQEEIEQAFNAAHFVECDNYRYGRTKGDIASKYTHLKYVIGSDAHAAKNVGAYLNQVDCEGDDLKSIIRGGDIQHIRNQQHTWRYWTMKRVKRSAPYQMLLHLFPTELRRKIKNTIFNR